MSAEIGDAAPPPPIRGEILKLDDIETGFSERNRKQNRPYLVIGVAGLRVRIVPQSTDIEKGVLVPTGTLHGLAEGCFLAWATTIPLSLALAATCIGHLPDPYLAAALEQARPWP